MKKLTVEEVNGKMTWQEVIKYYKHECPDDLCEYILWNETCYPFDDETTLNQIYDFFNQKV